MITTKTIGPDIKKIYRLSIQTLIRRFVLYWLCTLVIGILIYRMNPDEAGNLAILLIPILFPIGVFIQLWKYLHSERAIKYRIERYYAINTETLTVIYGDNTSKVVNLENYKKVNRISSGYLLIDNDKKFAFIPFYAFNNYEELNYFETEVADKINKNTYFRDHRNIKSNINFEIPETPIPRVKLSKKKRRYIKIGIIVLVLACLSLFIHTCIKFFPKVEIQRGNNNYLKLIKDSIKKDIDTKYIGNIVIIENGNLFYHCNYSTSHHKHGFTKKDTVYYIDFWEFKNLSKVDLKTINIKQKKILDEVNKYLNSIIFYVDSNPLIKSKLNFDFINSKMDVNLDYQTEVYNMIDSINYKGFFGKVNAMSFTDEKGEPQIFFKYKFPKKALLILYKTDQSFIIIRVNCNHDEAINENVINFFNLK